MVHNGTHFKAVESHARYTTVRTLLISVKNFLNYDHPRSFSKLCPSIVALHKKSQWRISSFIPETGFPDVIFE